MDAQWQRRADRATAFMFLASLALIASVALPLWRPLLLAAVLAGSLAGWHDRFARKLGNRRTISATLFTIALVLVILIPIGLAATFVIGQTAHLIKVVRDTLQQQGVGELLRPLPDDAERWLRDHYEQLRDQPHATLSEMGVWSRSGAVLGVTFGVLGKVSHLLFALVLMLIAFFFLLRDGRTLVAWLKTESPVPSEHVDGLTRELAAVSRSVIGGQILTGGAQAVVATGGYFIAGVPNPLIVGLLTFMASLIPSVGTAIVGLPAAGLLVLLGHPWWALFLAGWMLGVVGLVDNLVRPLLIRRGANLHGALIFFALIGGMLMFGAIGVVVGPIALAFFLAMSRTLRGARAAH